jgi:hypothetical protein
LRRAKEKRRIDLGKRVIVIGGGNTAIDCARTARRLGSSAQIFYRRTPEEMPASKDEILEAKEEGIPFTFLVSPLKILGKKDRVTGVKFFRNRLGKKGPDGRRVPVAIKAPISDVRPIPSFSLWVKSPILKAFPNLSKSQTIEQSLMRGVKRVSGDSLQVAI